MLWSVVKSHATSSLFKAPLGGFIILDYTRGTSEMTPRDNTPYRFRFSVVLFLIFLLTSPTKASSEAESCAAVALAWNGVEVKFSLGKDPEFVRNLAECLKGVKKTYSEIQGIIQQLPELIDKALPVAKSEGLVLLSLYLLYRSYVLYDDAMIMGVNVTIYRDKLDLLRREMKPLRDFMDTELIPQWENGNTTGLEKTTDRLLEKMGRFSRVIDELIKDIFQDYKKAGSDQRFSCFVTIGAGVLCLYSFRSPSLYVSIAVCGAAVGTAGFSWCSYLSLCETLPKLEVLKKDSTKMNEEITNYQTKLDLMRMRAELKGEL